MYDDESSDELLQDDFGEEDTTVEPEVVHPEPEIEPAPQPEPAPEPTPEPQPAPAPVPPQPSEEEFSGEVLDKMAAHLRKRERLSITLDEAMWKILTDPVTNAEYKKLKDLGKF